MALQSIGQISLKQIASEFSDGAPHKLTEFYKGGSLVNASVSANSGVPASGQITLTDFYGTQGALWSITVSNGYGNFNAGIFVVFYNGFKSGTSEDNLFSASNNIGSANDTTVDFLGGSNLIVLGESTVDAEGIAGVLVFEVAGAHSNSGFTTLKIGGVDYNRTDATYTQGSSNTRWAWNTTSGAAPFGENSAQQATTSIVVI